MFHPYARDPQTLARPWAVPGTAGLEHRIGGIEKADVTGVISYDPDNHERMTHLRRDKIAGIAASIPALEQARAHTRAVGAQASAALAGLPDNDARAALGALVEQVVDRVG